MATPLRKKRNFRGLQLAVEDNKPSPPVLPQTDPVAVRNSPAPATTTTVNPSVVTDTTPMLLRPTPAANPAPAPPGKKRPPPMTLKAPKVPPPNITPVEDNLLTVTPAPNSAPNTASYPSMRRNTYHAHLSNALANMDLNSERKFELRAEDLKDLQELGQGNGGSVKKAEHVPTGTIMAKKIVLIDAKPTVRKQILRELQILHDCQSPYIVSFYGAFLADPNICICMEFMDKGSLDNIYKKIGAIDIDIVAKVALAVLEGLTYLYDKHRIIHRDIKPSNIVFNSAGEIKVCDFGVSGELINSIADTFVGTSTYMSPERIQGAQYTVKSDVWSLGISLIELALGRFPFTEDEESDEDSDEEFAEWNQKRELYGHREEDEDLEGTLSPARPGTRGLQSLLSSNANSNGTLHAHSANRSSLSAAPSAKAKQKKEKRKSKGVSLQGGGMTMSILELLQHIVNEPAPRLNPLPSAKSKRRSKRESYGYPFLADGEAQERSDKETEKAERTGGVEGRFPKVADDFVECCLLKDPEKRWTPKGLLKHEWMEFARRSEVDLEAWAATF